MSFNFDPSMGQTESSSSVDLRRRLSAAMLQQGMDTSPIRSPWQGVARLSEALMGGLAVRNQAQQEQESLKQGMAALTGQPYTPPAPSGGFLSNLFGSNDVPASGAQSQVASSAPASTGTPQQASAGKAPDDFNALVASNVPADMQGYVTNLVGKESSFDPNAVSSTGATGYAQFTRGTGSHYGLVGPGFDNRKDPVANLKALVALTNDNRSGLTQALGRAPTDGELALAHQQGLQGAIDLLNGRNVPANNLAVNGISPGTDPRAAANKIMAFYGGSGGPSAPTQVASLDPSAGMASAMPSASSQPIAPPPSPTAQPGDMSTVSPAQMQAMLGPQATPGYQDPTVTTAYRENAPASPAAAAINAQAPGMQPAPLMPTDPSVEQKATMVPAPNMPLNTGIDQPGSMQPAPNMPIDPTQTASVGPAGAQAGGGAAAPIPLPSQGTGAPSAAADQASPRDRLAQAVMSQPSSAPGSFNGGANTVASNPRAQALAAAMMNPYAPPQLRSLLGAALQTQLQPHTQIVTNPNTGTTYLVDTWTGQKQLIDQGQTADSEIEKDANGNPIGIFNKRTGEYRKMGDPTAQLDIVNRPDGSIIAVNKITGQQVAAPAGAMKTDSIVEGPVDPQTGYPTKLLWNPVDGVKGTVMPDGTIRPGGVGAPAQQQPSAGLTPPPGVDPKKFRETAATRAAEAAMPSAKDENDFASSMMARPSYKEFSAAVPTWNSFTQHIQDNSPASDKAIVDDFAKILNPGRAVTTGSFQLNMDAQSVPDYLQGQIMKAFTGQGELGPDARAQMARIAQLKVQEYQRAWNLDAAQGTKIATSHGLNVGNVIPNVPSISDIDFSKINGTNTNRSGSGPAGAVPTPQQAATPSVAPTGAPTATGANGEKYQLSGDGKSWILIGGPTANPNSNINRVPTGN